ncbi:Tn3 family transposase [Nonomuraea sp. NPDC003214]
MLSSCTHVSDQHSTFGTKTSHRSPQGAFRAGRLSEQRHRPPPFEHLSDTNGVMLINFGLFELVGKLLSPAHPRPGQDRVDPGRDAHGDGQALPACRAASSASRNEDLITECWPDLLRMAGSLKCGQATASLVVGK